MGKCLINVCGNVDTDLQLPKLGCMRIRLKPNLNNAAVVIGTDQEGESIISLIEGSASVTLSDGTPIAFPYESALRTSVRKFTTGSEGATIEISNKYALSYFEPVNFAQELNIYELKYCRNLKRLLIGSESSGDVNVIKDNSVDFLTLGINQASTSLYASGLEFLKHVTATVFGLVNIKGDIIGSIDDVNPSTEYISMSEGSSYPYIAFSKFNVQRGKMLILYKANLGNDLESYLETISKLTPISSTRNLIVNGKETGKISAYATAIRNKGHQGNIIINGVSY